jgi:hypothetical protein
LQDSAARQTDNRSALTAIAIVRFTFQRIVMTSPRANG